MCGNIWTCLCNLFRSLVRLIMNFRKNKSQDIKKRCAIDYDYDSTWEDESQPEKKYKCRWNRYAVMDMKAFRCRCQNLEDDESDDDRICNLLFYRGEIRSIPDDVSIKEFHDKWKGDYDRLEDVHTYIQWLFPIQEPGVNCGAYVLTKKEIKLFQTNEEVKSKLLESYKLMLDFYGIELVDADTGEVKRAANWEDRFDNLNRYSHNNLRITRILKCLGTLGLQKYQAPLVKFFLEETLVKKTLERVKLSVLDYFMFAVLDKSERKELIRYAFEHFKPQKKFVWCPEEIRQKWEKESVTKVKSKTSDLDVHISHVTVRSLLNVDHKGILEADRTQIKMQANEILPGEPINANRQSSEVQDQEMGDNDGDDVKPSTATSESSSQGADDDKLLQEDDSDVPVGGPMKTTDKESNGAEISHDIVIQNHTVESEEDVNLNSKLDGEGGSSGEQESSEVSPEAPNLSTSNNAADKPESENSCESKHEVNQTIVIQVNPVIHTKGETTQQNSEKNDQDKVQNQMRTKIIITENLSIERGQQSEMQDQEMSDNDGDDVEPPTQPLQSSSQGADDKESNDVHMKDQSRENSVSEDDRMSVESEENVNPEGSSGEQICSDSLVSGPDMSHGTVDEQESKPGDVPVGGTMHTTDTEFNGASSVSDDVNPSKLNVEGGSSGKQICSGPCRSNTAEVKQKTSEKWKEEDSSESTEL